MTDRLPGEALIPLHDRNGRQVAAAIVDADMAATLNQHRWYLSHRGYAVRTARRKGRRVTVAMHRQVMGVPDVGGPAVRHLNGDPLDNRRTNLAVSRRYLARRIEADPDLQALVLRLAASSTN